MHLYRLGRGVETIHICIEIAGTPAEELKVVDSPSRGGCNRYLIVFYYPIIHVFYQCSYMLLISCIEH